jgi:hypothetical protein
MKKERIVGMIYHADLNPEEVVCYHIMMTGSVNWAIALGRCDIQYAVSALSRRNMAPPCDEGQQLASMLVSPASQLIVDPIMCLHPLFIDGTTLSRNKERLIIEDKTAGTTGHFLTRLLGRLDTSCCRRILNYQISLVNMASKSDDRARK